MTIDKLLVFSIPSWSIRTSKLTKDGKEYLSSLVASLPAHLQDQKWEIQCGTFSRSLEVADIIAKALRISSNDIRYDDLLNDPDQSNGGKVYDLLGTEFTRTDYTHAIIVLPNRKVVQSLVDKIRFKKRLTGFCLKDTNVAILIHLFTGEIEEPHELEHQQPEFE